MLMASVQLKFLRERQERAFIYSLPPSKLDAGVQWHSPARNFRCWRSACLQLKDSRRYIASARTIQVGLTVSQARILDIPVVRRMRRFLSARVAQSQQLLLQHGNKAIHVVPARPACVRPGLHRFVCGVRGAQSANGVL